IYMRWKKNVKYQRIFPFWQRATDSWNMIIKAEKDPGDMEKTHFISFFAYVTAGTVQMVKLYPEQNAEARFARRGHGYIYACCNRHGLYRIRI
ncbi:MAG: hypothetical protein K2P02_01675, partial [Lachnospiraceae bacterium]|nr:hypothetical protein [Lachnospiraceae bacterium]